MSQRPQPQVREIDSDFWRLGSVSGEQRQVVHHRHDSVDLWLLGIVAVAFHRVVMPDGSTFTLDRLTGLNQIGDAGLRDQVNQHYWSTFGAAAAVGLVTGLSQFLGAAGLSASEGNRTVIIAGGAADATSQAGLQVMNRFLNRLPTITIREGHRIKVYLTSDLELPAYNVASGSERRATCSDASVSILVVTGAMVVSASAQLVVIDPANLMQTVRIAQRAGQVATCAGARVLSDAEGKPLMQKVVQVMLRRAARRATVKPGVHILRHHVLFALGDAGSAGASHPGARRPSGSRGDAALDAPESGSDRGSYPTFGDEVRGSVGTGVEK